MCGDAYSIVEPTRSGLEFHTPETESLMTQNKMR